jgi:hypothetical protein
MDKWLCKVVIVFKSELLSLIYFIVQARPDNELSYGFFSYHAELL